MVQPQYLDFIKESNSIENIHREPTEEETHEFLRFLKLKTVTVKDLEKFISVYAQGHILRVKPHHNVTVGTGSSKYYAPFGGKQIREKLQVILDNMGESSVFKTHVDYELLHPFTDGNGRSGRMLWAWQMNKNNGEFPALKFLHLFYYQTLQNEGRKVNVA